MALIRGGQQRWEGDLLAVIGGVDVEFVVVNADFIVGVAGGESDLEIGGEEVWRGEVEGVNGGILEDEMWLRGSEDEPYKEDYEEDGEDEGEEGGQEAAVELFPVVVVVAAVLGRHVAVVVVVVVEVNVVRGK